MKSRAIVLLATMACAASPATRVREQEPSLSPLQVADRLQDTIAFFGVDFADRAPSSLVGTWTRTHCDSGARVLERAGYRVKTASGSYARLARYTNARFGIVGRLLGLTVSPSAEQNAGSGAVDVQVEWTLFDADANVVARRATTSAHVAPAVTLDATVAAATSASLAEFLANDSVKSMLPLSSTAPVAAWRRPLPARDDTIQLTTADANVDTRGSVLEGALSAVASLRGSAGVGSAFLLSKDGLAITNYHVVRNQRGLVARLRDGSGAAVRVVRTDSVADLALLEIACATGCFTIDLYRGIPAIGDDVYAIGTPVSEQFSHSVTKGIVSGVRQRGDERLLQTDAALNRGNSGGPLVEARTARVVGIVSRKLMTDGIEAMGFAIVIDDALRLLAVAPGSVGR